MGMVGASWDMEAIPVGERRGDPSRLPVLVSRRTVIVRKARESCCRHCGGQSRVFVQGPRHEREAIKRGWS